MKFQGCTNALGDHVHKKKCTEVFATLLYDIFIMHIKSLAHHLQKFHEKNIGNFLVRYEVIIMILTHLLE